MNQENPQPRSWGAIARTGLLFWLVMAATMLVLVLGYLPLQQRVFQENLAAEARGLAASLHGVVAAAAVSGDFSSAVDHCVEVIHHDAAIDYFVVARNDGFSMICDRAGWRFEKDAAPLWRPECRQVISDIGVVPLFNRRVFYYSEPFDYSGISWGWVHVGLNLESYERSQTRFYWRAGVLAVLCLPIAVLGSVFYGRRIQSLIGNKL